MLFLVDLDRNLKDRPPREPGAKRAAGTCTGAGSGCIGDVVHTHLGHSNPP